MGTYARDNGMTTGDLIDMIERLSSSGCPADAFTLEDEREAALEPPPIVTPPAFTTFKVNAVANCYHHPKYIPVIHYLPACDQWSREKGHIHEPSG